MCSTHSITQSPNCKDHTIRTPNLKGETTIDGPKGGATLNQKIRRQAKPESAKVWQMLNPDEKDNQIRIWETFANHYEKPGETKRWESNVSLESWHDDIHILVGSGDHNAGNMAKVPVAGVC